MRFNQIIKLEPDTLTTSAVVFKRLNKSLGGGYGGTEGQDTVCRNKCGENWVGLRTLLFRYLGRSKNRGKEGL